MKNINTIDSGWLEQVTGGTKRTTSVSRLGGSRLGTLGLGGGLGTLGAGSLGTLGLSGIPGLGFGNHALARKQKEDNDTMLAVCMGCALSRK